MLSVPQPLDDTFFAEASTPVLWVTDPVRNVVDRVTGPFVADQAVTSVAPDSGSSYLATVDLSTGALTSISGLESIAPKGMIFTSAASSPLPSAPPVPTFPTVPTVPPVLPAPLSAAVPTMPGSGTIAFTG